jgi:hypothetical protein
MESCAVIILILIKDSALDLVTIKRRKFDIIVNFKKQKEIIGIYLFFGAQTQKFMLL